MADLYRTLGVSRDAAHKDIKRTYRKLAGELHPDKNAGPKAEQRFKEVTAAYEVLNDKKKRALYDEFGEVSLQSGFDAKAARAAKNFGGYGGGMGGRSVPFDLGDLFAGGARGGGGGGGGGGGFGDMFGDLLGRNRGGVAGPRAGQDIQSTLSLSFADAVLGTTLRLSPSAGGEVVSVRIPAGAQDGSKVRVRGKGAPSPQGGPRGDLLLLLEVETHPYFRRDGDDLHIDLPITLKEAYLGAQVPIPTPKGEVKLKVPKGTQSGQKLRLRGRGVARQNKPAGDLYVRFMVMYPDGDDAPFAEVVGALEDSVPTAREGLSF